MLVLWGLFCQAVLISLVIFLVAGPFGRLSASWAVVDGRDLDHFRIASRHCLPPVCWAAVATCLFLATVGSWKTRRRRTIEIAVFGMLTGAIALVSLLIAVPLAVSWFTAQQLGAALSASAALLGGVVGGLATKVLAAKVAPQLTRLGGILMVIAMTVSALFIAREAATPDGLFGGPEWRAGYGLALALFIAAWAFLDPRWWSLHIVYRHRLRGAFAVTTDKRRAQSGHPWVTDEPGIFPVSSAGEPQLDEYAGSAGPEPLICASVARTARTATGVTALSFVLSPNEISLYDIRRTGERIEVRDYSCPTSKYLDYIGPKAPSQRASWSVRGRRRQALGTITTAMALSGAAVTSAMGRSSLGTTDSLLAALNVRLGTWLPNPRYVPGPGEESNTCRSTVKRARLNYLLQEILGGYDVDEPYLYVTDGDHRENLGLVELLRRRCKVIICIDASGDPPGGFGTLMQAVRLARTEVGARIEIDPASLQQLRAGDPYVLPSTCSMRLPVYYGDASKAPDAYILYAKAVVDTNAPELAAFREEDPAFPNYSTGNQFLSDIQVRMLVRLGKHMAAQLVQLGSDPVPDTKHSILLDAVGSTCKAEPQASPSGVRPALEVRLGELKAAFDGGLIDETAYSSKQHEILNDL